MDNDLRSKALDAITPVVKKQAYAMADRVVAFFQSTGARSDKKSLLDLLGLGARLTKADMVSMGLSSYIPMETEASEAAAAFVETCPNPKLAAEVVKYAAFRDVVMTELKHFSPRQLIAEQAVEAKEDTAYQFNVPQDPKPVTPVAKRWMEELSSPLHHLPVSPVSFQPVASIQNDEPDEAEILAIRAKATITEREAAKLLSMTPKELGNMRRAGKIPRNIYCQNGKGKRVRYFTAALLEWSSGNMTKKIQK